MTRPNDFPQNADDGGAESTPPASAQTHDGVAVQGSENTILGDKAVNVQGSVGGDIITGFKEVIHIIQDKSPLPIVALVAIVALALVVILSMTFFALSRFWQPPSNEYSLPTANNAPTAASLDLATDTPSTPAENPVVATPSPPPCYVQGADNETILRCLIALEGDALAQKDISIIDGIFAPDALIGNAVSGEFWGNPHTRYESYFNSIQTARVTQIAVQPVARGLLENVAWFTSGDQSHVLPLEGTEQIYENKPGSNHWTFAKNAQGCWQITSLIFNAGHINFPCYCNQASDAENLSCLIDAESRAVSEENPVLIWVIFAPDAGIQDGDVLLSRNPLDFYAAERFVQYDYIGPEHVDITKIEIDDDQATYTSGSRGSYRDANGTVFPYDNPNPADRWKFQRNAAGCWAITSFAFNQK